MNRQEDEKDEQTKIHNENNKKLSLALLDQQRSEMAKP